MSRLNIFSLTLAALMLLFDLPAEAASDKVVARQGTWELTLEEVDAGIQGPLFQLKEKMFALRFERIQDLISDRLLKVEAEARGTTPEKLIEEVLLKAGTATSDADVEAFIKIRKDQLPPVTPKLKGQIREFLTAKRLEEAQADFFVGLAKKYKVETQIAPPVRPRLKIRRGNEAQSKGPKDAPITIVEFSDFQCPYCRRAQANLKEMNNKFPGKIRFVFKHFPLPSHTLAPKASEASICAGDQGKFWPYHDELFVMGADMRPDGLKAIAKKLKLDLGRFDDCLNGGLHAVQIYQDMEEGKRLGVNGTPTFFINGMMMVGTRSMERMISKELELLGKK